MNRLHRVAILIDTVRSLGRGLLRGITRYRREHEKWTIVFLPQDEEAPLPRWLTRWDGDGILARVFNPELAAALHETGVPVVDFANSREQFGFPQVCVDNGAVVRLGAEYLLQKGFRHFGFCGKARGVNSRWDERSDLFGQHIKAAGYPCNVFQVPPCHQPAGPWAIEHDEIAAWLRSLPKPVGILAGNDERGQHVLAACTLAGVQVPDEVAVLGVDNDELVCDLCDPPLSSVQMGFERLGYAGAHLLDRLMSGKKPPRAPIEFSPLYVVTRQSTDVLAMADRELAAALRLIREQAGRGMKVEEILAAVPMSRSRLERCMKMAIGRTPKAEIIRVQLNRAKELLLGTDMSLAAIAAEVGYAHSHYLSEIFRSKFGRSPREFRQEMRK